MFLQNLFAKNVKFLRLSSYRLLVSSLAAILFQFKFNLYLQSDWLTQCKYYFNQHTFSTTVYMYSCLVALEGFSAPIPTQSAVPLSSPDLFFFEGGGSNHSFHSSSSSVLYLLSASRHLNRFFKVSKAVSLILLYKEVFLWHQCIKLFLLIIINK